MSLRCARGCLFIKRLLKNLLCFEVVELEERSGGMISSGVRTSLSWERLVSSMLSSTGSFNTGASNKDLREGYRLG